MTHHILRYFKYDHLPVALHSTASVMSNTAWLMYRLVPDGPEKEVGLRKLLEAKDCFIRASLDLEQVPPVKCNRNTDEVCDCGQCTHVRNYPRHSKGFHA